MTVRLITLAVLIAGFSFACWSYHLHHFGRLITAIAITVTIMLMRVIQEIRRKDNG